MGATHSGRSGRPKMDRPHPKVFKNTWITVRDRIDPTEWDFKENSNVRFCTPQRGNGVRPLKDVPHVPAGGGEWTFGVSSKSHSVGSMRFLTVIQVFLSTLGCGRSIFGRPERPEWVAPTRHTAWKNRPKSGHFWPHGIILCLVGAHTFWSALLCGTR